MRRRPRHIRVRYGQFEFAKLNAEKFDWRDTYHLILTLSWPGFAGLVFGIYLLINLVFAALYMLNAHAVAEMRPGSFFDAFFFSVETLATVGYGHMYPESFYGHLITMLEIVLGMFGLAVITGLIFVRFSRPTARLHFSKVAVIAPFDGVPNLMIRVANLRHQAMVEPEFRMILLRNSITAEGDEVRRFRSLKLEFDHLIAFPTVLTARHRIDKTSPLLGMTLEGFQQQDIRIIASIVGVDTVPDWKRLIAFLVVIVLGSIVATQVLANSYGFHPALGFNLLHVYPPWSYGIKCYLISQDINQLKSRETGYGPDETITSNCHVQVAFPPNRLETAEHLSKLTGQTTIIKEQVTRSGRGLGSQVSNDDAGSATTSPHAG